MELADRFQIDVVLSKCENWLIENPGPSLAECLMLSERYRLMKLRQSSLDRLRYPATIVDLRKKVEIYKELSQETKVIMFERLCDIMEQTGRI